MEGWVSTDPSVALALLRGLYSSVIKPGAYSLLSSKGGSLYVLGGINPGCQSCPSCPRNAPAFSLEFHFSV